MSSLTASGTTWRQRAPIRLETLGTHRLKGVPGSWEVFAVVS
ncbi:MAG: hypothetical protein ACLQFR_17905 [Streptosporangiaceae bacterium]